MKPLRVFTCVWGEHHTNLFLKGTVKTLAWPANKAALDGAIWTVVTRSDHAAKIQTALTDTFPNVKVEMKVIPATIKMQMGEVDSNRIDGSVLILMHLQGEIQACIQTKSQFLMAPPDTLFGEHTVGNLRLAGAQEGTCVAVAHPRVLTDIIEDIEATEPLSNQMLCRKALQVHAHQAWAGAEKGHKAQNSLVGGISWEKFENDESTLYSVQHRLPTVYLANFIPEDLAFFINQPSFGSWDHTWPGERLIRQERQRTIGSSDAAFICEVTEFDKNIPPWSKEMMNVLEAAPDAFYRDSLHNCIQRQFLTIFRA